MKINYLSLLLLLSAAAHASPQLQSPEPEIYNVKHGLFSYDSGKVYLETDHVAYKPNGTCLVAGHHEPCLQWGFSFSYRNIKPGSVLHCLFTTNQAGELVNPISRSGVREVLRVERDLTFTQSSGDFVLPSHLGREPTDQGTLVFSSTCSLDSREEIRFDFAIDLDVQP